MKILKMSRRLMCHGKAMMNNTKSEGKICG